MTFEIPSDLNPALVGLAWLRGRWEGSGYREWPGEEKIEFAQQIDFADNGGGYLHYLSQTFEMDDKGVAVRPLSMETGFWRPQPDDALGPRWCVTFEVDDVDAARQRVVDAGGEAPTDPWDFEYGRVSTVTGLDGEEFSLMTSRAMDMPPPTGM